MHDFRALYPSIRYDPKMTTNPVRWLVDGLWQLGKINGMAGYEKSGKSRLLCWALVGMSKGEVLGMPSMAQRVLYLCGEETIDVVNARVKRYAALQEIPDALFDIDFVEAASMQLDLASARKGLIEKLLDEDREMLVIDPMRRVHNADENDSNAMSKILNDFRKWSNKYNITIVLVHHTPKIIKEDVDMDRIATWFRGSTDLAAIVDTAQYVDRLNKKSILVLRKGRFPPLDPLQITDNGGRDVNDDKGFTRAN